MERGGLVDVEYIIQATLKAWTAEGEGTCQAPVFKREHLWSQLLTRSPDDLLISLQPEAGCQAGWKELLLRAVSRASWKGRRKDKKAQALESRPAPVPESPLGNGQQNPPPRNFTRLS